MYNYEKYADKTTSLANSKVIDVSSVDECAVQCSGETNFTCRSFNYCNINSNYKCLLSENHLNSAVKNPDVVFSPICSHYSSKHCLCLFIFTFVTIKLKKIKEKTLYDFKLLPQTQLNLSPRSKYLNITTEVCAQLCTDTEGYVCRSFDFFNSSNNCFLYEANIRDIHFTGVVLPIENPNCSHYSRNSGHLNIVKNKNLIFFKIYSLRRIHSREW